jgi:hypothetical protein
MPAQSRKRSRPRLAPELPTQNLDFEALSTCAMAFHRACGVPSGLRACAADCEFTRVDGREPPEMTDALYTCNFAIWRSAPVVRRLAAL